MIDRTKTLRRFGLTLLLTTCFFAFCFFIAGLLSYHSVTLEGGDGYAALTLVSYINPYGLAFVGALAGFCCGIIGCLYLGPVREGEADD